MQDTGHLGGLQGPQDTSFYAMRRPCDTVEVIKADPAVETVQGFTGGRWRHQHRLRLHGAEAVDERQVTATR